jgi:F420-0:gamma-glutamyl ligase
MKIEAIKTRLVHAGEISIEDLLSESIQDLSEKSVVAISSKVVALCENRVVKIGDISKDELIARESEKYIDRSFSPMNVAFAVIHGQLAPSAGIDESNADGHYVLWPRDPQQSANSIRQFLRDKFGCKDLGVILTDSTNLPPLKWGTIGVSIAQSGFEPLKSYIGSPDLFGRDFAMSQLSIGGGLAAAANVVMGEGQESTPIAIVSDIDFVKFVEHDPTPQDLARTYVPFDIDIYVPFLQSAPWKKGGARKS